MNIGIITSAKDHYVPYSLKRLSDVAIARGHTVKRIYYPACVLSFQDGLAKCFLRGEDISDLDAVIPWIIQAKFSYGMKVLGQFESNKKIFVLNGTNGFSNAYDKVITYQKLCAANVPIINTDCGISLDDVQDMVDRRNSMPAVIKTLHGTKGRGTMLAKDRNMATSIIETLIDGGVDVISQDYIKESSGSDIRAYVVGSRVVASMERRAASSDHFKANISNGGSGAPINLTDAERDIAIRSVQALGMQVAGVDILRSDSGPVVIEVNASGGFAIEDVTQVEVADLIIEMIEDELLKMRIRSQ